MKSLLVLSLWLCVAFVLTPRAFGSWLTDGNVMSAFTNDQLLPQMVSDGVGGAIVVWQDNRTGAADIYVQRVGPYGAMLWTVDGVALCTATGDQHQPTIVADGAGGAIVAWTDVRTGAGNDDIYVQRVNAAGVSQWTVNGVALCTATNIQTTPAVVTDGAGGAIVAWGDGRDGLFQHIYAARVNAAGVPQWASNGVLLTNSTCENPKIVSDGLNGAIVAWEDYRTSTSDVYAQRVDASGIPVWTTDGVAVSTATDYQRELSVIFSAGGAIIAWDDERSTMGTDIYVQRLNGAGVPQWTADGVALTPEANSTRAVPAISSDGAGGAIVAWQETSFLADIKARRINSSGTPLWALGGVSVCSAANDQTKPQIVTDNAGGVIITWQDDRNFGSTRTDTYAQRMNSSGIRQWALDGVSLCTASSYQRYPAITTDGDNGAIVSWQDERNAGTSSRDVYALRVGGSGLVPTSISGSTPSAALVLGNAYPNPFSSATSMDIALRTPSEVKIVITDVAGRRVRTITMADVPAGSHRLDFDGQDHHGRRLPSGVYFWRVTAAGATQTRKLVIAR